MSVARRKLKGKPLRVREGTFDDSPKKMNDTVNGDKFDVSAGPAGPKNDYYNAIMGVKTSDATPLINPKVLAKPSAKKENQAREEKNDLGWFRNSVRPPNRMTIRLKYHDRITQNPVGIGTNAGLTTVLYCCNSLWKHNTNAGAAEKMPLLTGYTGIWNRALVMYAKYQVTWVNLNSTQYMRGFIGFQPYNQQYATVWATLDAQVSSEANSQWCSVENISPSTLPMSQVTLEFGKYLPDVYGDADQYMSTIDNATIDFSQVLPSTTGGGALGNGPLTNSQVTAQIGVLTNSGTNLFRLQTSV